MFKIRFNEQHSLIVNTVFGIGLGLASLIVLCLPSYAGPQSLLDPYADVSSTKESKPTSKKAVKQAVRQRASDSEELSVSGNDTNRDQSSSDMSDKTKAGKGVKTKISKGDNPGFLSGVKEVQHGYVTSMKAAGGGIIDGSKAAGAKVAAGTKAIGGGIVAASQKVFSGPKALAANVTPAKKEKKKKTPQIADASAIPPSAPHTILPVLPGEPLDQVLAEQKERKRLKDVAVTGEAKKPGIITSAVGKLHIFHKAKKKTPDNLTANNPNAVAR